MRKVEDVKKLVEEFRCSFKSSISMTQQDDYLEIASLTKSDSPNLIATINEFMVSKNFLDIGDSWNELSRRGALQHLRLVLEAEQLLWFNYQGRNHVPATLSQGFVDFFSDTASFFTHWIAHELEEHSVDPSFQTFSIITKNQLEMPQGLVAVDGEFIGYFLLNSSLDL